MSSCVYRAKRSRFGSQVFLAGSIASLHIALNTIGRLKRERAAISALRRSKVEMRSLLAATVSMIILMGQS